MGPLAWMLGFAFALPIPGPVDGPAIAAVARRYVSTRPVLLRDDCSGFVTEVLQRAGHDLDGNTTSLWALAEASGWVHRDRPQPGDIAFFDRTYDRNRNGEPDDELTHIAVVMSVDLDGTIHLAHRGRTNGIAELRMNLEHPVARWLGQKEANDYLGQFPRQTDEERLAAALFRGFATLGGLAAEAPPTTGVPTE